MPCTVNSFQLGPAARGGNSWTCFQTWTTPFIQGLTPDSRAPAEKRPEVSVGSMLRSCRGYVGLRPSRIEGPPLGPCWAGWAHLGPILGLSWGQCWAYVGLCWLYVGPMLAYVSPILAHVGPVLALCWPYVGPTLAYVGPMLAHLGAYVEAMLAICETISVERPPRCQFFLPGSVRGTKNHVKTTVLHFRQQKSACPSTQNTVQNDVFVTSHARNTVKYGDFSR